MTEAALRPAATVRVWSAAVRCGHFVLAGTVLGALLLYEGGPWHERLGYVALLTAGWRVLYGFAASDRYACFANFVQPWAATWSYARALRARQEPHHLGHNPLGGWMIVALLVSALLAAGSGALYATDEFWGDALVYGVHQAAGWALAVLVPLHVVGVVFTSMRQRENLLRAMVTGVKTQPPAPTQEIQALKAPGVHPGL
jgi:cytochrome b